MRKLRLSAALFLFAVALCACAKKPKDNEIDYYTKVGSYAEPTEGVYEAGEKDLELLGENPSTVKPSGGVTTTPTPTPVPHYVVVIDAGHGGSQTGASYDGRAEKDVNLKVASMVKEYLSTHYENVDVYMTRTEDKGLAKDVADDLRMRVEFAAEKQADILVSFHFNSSDKHSRNGSMVCISKQPQVREGSEQLAKCILARLASLGLKNNGPYLRDSNDMKDENGVALDYYAIPRHGAAHNLIAVIVESCYMDSKTDIPYMKDDAALTVLAEQEALGIMEFLTQYYVKQ